MNLKMRKRIIHILNLLMIIFICSFIGLKIYINRLSLNAMIITQTIFLIILLLIIIYGLAYKVKKPKSIVDLGAIIEKWKDSSWYEEKDKKAEELEREYYFSASLSFIVSILVIGVVGVAAFAQIYHSISKSILFITWAILLSIPIVREAIAYKSNMKICDILYDKCDPYTCIMAFYKIMSFKRGKQFQVRDSNKLLVGNMLYFTGEFEFTLSFIEAIEQEVKRKNKQDFFFQSQYIKFLCLINLKRNEEALKIYEDIINEVQKNPKLKRNKIVASIVPKLENNVLFIKGDFKRARLQSEINFKGAATEHQRVSSQFRLFQIEKALGNEEGVKERREYILLHGKDLFYVSKCDLQEKLMD